MKNKVLVLGYFSYIKYESCGQSIKTRNIYNLLKEKGYYIGNVKMFDTEQFQQSKIFIIKMIWEIWHCEKLVYVPAQNNLKYIFPFIYLICKIKRIDILYFVVGGWLVEYLQAKRFHRYLLSNIQVILPESNHLRNKLIEQYNFKNVTTFPNFRVHTFTPTFVQHRDNFRIVFMARISRMKGLDIIFKLAEHIESLQLNHRPIIIDFYGLMESDEDYFRNNIKKYSFINYNGILEPDQIYNVLNGYDLMVLPTKYYTEGFPGSVLDAYISGIPVIVTKWKYATEFVGDGETGFIVPFENGEKDFIDAVIKVYRDNNLLTRMKRKAYEQSRNYSSLNAWEILKEFLGN